MKFDRDFVKSILKDILMGLAVIIGLCSLGLIVVLNLRELYYYDIHKLSINGSSGLPSETIRKNYDLTMDYLNPFNKINELEVYNIRISDNALECFARLKVVLIGFLVVGIGCLIFSVIKCYKEYKIRNYDFFRKTFIIMFFIPVLILMFSWIDWSGVLTVLQKVVYLGIDYEFSWFEDELIRIFPGKYLLQCGMIIGAIVLTGSAVMWVAWYKMELGSVISVKKFKDGKFVDEFEVGNETFDRCFKYTLIELDGVTGWRVEAKKNITKFDCKSEFKGYPVISYNKAFYNYWGKDLQLISIDMSNVIDARQMFDGCRSDVIDVRGLDFTNVKYMDKAFKSRYCSKMRLSNADKYRPLTADEMFAGIQCEVEGLTEINLENTKSANGMFNDFKGYNIVSVRECSHDMLNSITNIKDSKIVKEDEDIELMHARAKKMNVERLILIGEN